ncbi:MAG: sterol carrier protein domain-containing protein, partial [Actinomycetota bacterium]|nr:sterol carrier protein domain-containing protein [Actinomycetota bacterium]
LEAVHDSVRSARPGGLSRSAPWWDALFGEVEMYLGGGRRQLALVHRDDRGRPDGYAIYVVDEDWSRGQANHTLDVWELIGEDVGVEVALWRALVQHDLVATVTGAIAVDHALWDVVVDARQVASRWEQDLLWVRVLDVPAALAARRYGAADALVLSIRDPFLGRAEGTFRLETDAQGVAHCSPHDGPADLELDVADLGSTLLGGTSLRRLQRAGRIGVATADAAARFDAMASVDPAPWCWVRF